MPLLSKFFFNHLNKSSNSVLSKNIFSLDFFLTIQFFSPLICNFFLKFKFPNVRFFSLNTNTILIVSSSFEDLQSFFFYLNHFSRFTSFPSSFLDEPISFFTTDELQFCKDELVPLPVKKKGKRYFKNYLSFFTNTSIAPPKKKIKNPLFIVLFSSFNTKNLISSSFSLRFLFFSKPIFFSTLCSFLRKTSLFFTFFLLFVFNNIQLLF